MKDIKYNLELYRNVIKDTKKEFNKIKQIINKIDSTNNTNKEIPDYIKSDLIKLDNNNIEIKNKINNITNTIMEITKITKKIKINKEELKLLLKLFKSQCDNLPSDIHNYMTTINNLETFQILRNHFEPVKEHFGIVDDVVSGLKSAIASPLEKAARSVGDTLSSSLAPLYNKVNDIYKDASRDITSKFDDARKNLSSLGNIASGITDLMSTIKDGANAAFNAASKMDFIGPAKKLVQPAIDFVTEKFDTIKEFFSKLVSKIVDGYEYMIDKLKIVGEYLYDIAKKIAELGKNFYNEYLEPLFMNIFGVMKELFFFLWENIVPLLRRLVTFIIKELPAFIQKTVTNIKIFHGNFNKAPLVVIIISLLVFIGIQIYLNKLLGTQSTVPHLFLIFLTISIVLDQVNNNMNNLIYVQQYLSIIIIYIFKFKPIKQIFKLSDKFGEDYYLSTNELYSVYKKNKTKMLILVLILLVLMKKIISNLKTTIFKK